MDHMSSPPRAQHADARRYEHAPTSPASPVPPASAHQPAQSPLLGCAPPSPTPVPRTDARRYGRAPTSPVSPVLLPPASVSALAHPAAPTPLLARTPPASPTPSLAQLVLEHPVPAPLPEHPAPTPPPALPVRQAGNTPSPAQDDEEVNVFVKYLPTDTGDAGLRALFAQHGTVVSARVITDPVTGTSQGFGYALPYSIKQICTIRFSRRSQKKQYEAWLGSKSGPKPY